MNLLKLAGTIPALALVVSAGAASAASVTPDIIFGSGNDNGSFTKTVEELSFPNNPIGGDIELGLRAKLRYNSAGAPENTFNWDGTDTYSFDLSDSDRPSNRAMWNFEWSVNIDDLKNENTGDQLTIGQLLQNGGKLELSYDIDPTSAVDFVTYDLFGTDGTGFYVGDNSTPNGQKKFSNGDFLFPGVNETDSFGDSVANSTVAQNSVNYGFFPGIPGAALRAGEYDIKMTAFSFGGAELASTAIKVNVDPIPLPAAGWLLLTAFGGLGLAARRRRKAA